MGDNTHTQTVSSVNENSASGSVRVPAQIQREQGICIDDMVEVTIMGLDGLFNSLSFTNPQTAGDAVTVPASVVREADLELGSDYEMAFERIEGEPCEGEEAEQDDVDEILDEIETEIEEATEDEIEDAPSEDEEEEEPGLGELFG